MGRRRRDPPPTRRPHRRARGAAPLPRGRRGAPLTLRCPSCGEAALDDEARFCVGCGSALDAPPPAPVRTPPPPVIPPAPPDRLFIDAPTIGAPPEDRVPPPPPAELPAKKPAELPPLVPLWMVVAGVWGLIALLVVLLLSR